MANLRVYRWTFSAILCYNRNSDCIGCYYDIFFKGHGGTCMMKGCIPSLLEKFGPPPVWIPPVEKLCKDCLQIKPVSEFAESLARLKYDGLQPHCKECQKERTKAKNKQKEIDNAKQRNYNRPTWYR